MWCHQLKLVENDQDRKRFYANRHGRGNKIFLLIIVVEFIEKGYGHESKSFDGNLLRCSLFKIHESFIMLEPIDILATFIICKKMHTPILIVRNFS